MGARTKIWPKKCPHSQIIPDIISYMIRHGHPKKGLFYFMIHFYSVKGNKQLEDSSLKWIPKSRHCFPSKTNRISCSTYAGPVTNLYPSFWQNQAHFNINIFLTMKKHKLRFTDFTPVGTWWHQLWHLSCTTNSSWLHLFMCKTKSNFLLFSYVFPLTEVKFLLSSCMKHVVVPRCHASIFTVCWLKPLEGWVQTVALIFTVNTAVSPLSQSLSQTDRYQTRVIVCSSWTVTTVTTVTRCSRCLSNSSLASSSSKNAAAHRNQRDRSHYYCSGFPSVAAQKL